MDEAQEKADIDYNELLLEPICHAIAGDKSAFIKLNKTRREKVTETATRVIQTLNTLADDQ